METHMPIDCRGCRFKRQIGHGRELGLWRAGAMLILRSNKDPAIITDRIRFSMFDHSGKWIPAGIGQNMRI